MIRADFHCHTSASHDCFAAPAAVLATAQRRGLTHLAITDHDSLEAALRLRDQAGPVQVIVGCELSLRGGVHLIGLFLERPVKSRTPLEAAAEIREQGGFVYLPHPFHPGSGALAVGVPAALLAQVDAVEACNGHEPPERNALAVDLARAYQLQCLAGSDAHYGIDVGRACVELAAAEAPLSAASLRAALPGRLFGPTQDLSAVHAADARIRASTAPRARKFAPQAARRLAKWLVWTRCRQQISNTLREPVRRPFHG